MSTYSNRLQPALQSLLQRVVRFFHPRSSCMTHISADVQRITLNASCMTISGERTKQVDIFCRITGFTSDFLSFIDVKLIRFFHGSLQLFFLSLIENGWATIHCRLFKKHQDYLRNIFYKTPSTSCCDIWRLVSPNNFVTTRYKYFHFIDINIFLRCLVKKKTLMTAKKRYFPCTFRCT